MKKTQDRRLYNPSFSFLFLIAGVSAVNKFALRLPRISTAALIGLSALWLFWSNFAIPIHKNLFPQATLTMLL
jgi:hypothetical protein